MKPNTNNNYLYKLYAEHPQVIFRVEPNTITRGIGTNAKGLLDLLDSGKVRGNPKGRLFVPKLYNKLMKAPVFKTFIEKYPIIGKELTANSLSKQSFDIAHKYFTDNPLYGAPNPNSIIKLKSDPITQFKSYADYKNHKSDIEDSDKYPDGTPLAFFYEDGQFPNYDNYPSRFFVRVKHADKYGMHIPEPHLHPTTKDPIKLNDPNLEIFETVIGKNGKKFGIKLNKQLLLNNKSKIKQMNIQSESVIKTKLSDYIAMLVEETGVDTVIYTPQIETPQFKAWFKNSKVVEDDGSPRVVYHGTSRDFDTFSNKYGNVENHFGKAHYFSSDSSDVNKNYSKMEGGDLKTRIEIDSERMMNSLNDPPKYGTDEYDKLEQKIREKVIKKLGVKYFNVMPCYLSIQKPLYLGFEKHKQYIDLYTEQYDEETDDYGDGKYSKYVEKLKNIIIKRTNSPKLAERIINSLIDDLGYETTLDELINTLHKSDDLIEFDDYFDNGTILKNDIIKDIIKSYGFDGIIMNASKAFPYMGLNPDTIHYLVFRPTQIKSAIGNNGDFNSKSKKITENKI